MPEMLLCPKAMQITCRHSGRRQTGISGLADQTGWAANRQQFRRSRSTAVNVSQPNMKAEAMTACSSEMVWLSSRLISSRFAI